MKKLVVMVLCLFSWAGITYSSDDRISFKDFIPKWEVGDWWVLESVFVVDRWAVGPRPGPVFTHSSLPVWRYLKIRHRFEVKAIGVLNGKDTWQIHVKPTELPEKVVDNSSGNWVWQLFIDKESMALKKIAYQVRDGVYCIEGDVKEKGEKEIPPEAPAARLLAQKYAPPLLIPLYSEFTGEGLTKQTKLKFNADENVSQNLQIVEDDSGSKTFDLFVITVQHEEVSKMILKPNNPWCSSWDKFSTTLHNGGGVISSRLISWRGMANTVKEGGAPQDKK